MESPQKKAKVCSYKDPRRRVWVSHSMQTGESAASAKAAQAAVEGKVPTLDDVKALVSIATN